jgi:hypothetical protein
MQSQPSQPVMVRVIEEQPVDSTTAADVLIGSIGLAGVLFLIAIVLGGILGGLIIGFKRLRARFNMEPVPDSEALKISPFP